MEERGRGGEDIGREERRKTKKDSTEKVKVTISAQNCREIISDYCMYMYMLTKLRVISFVEEQEIINTLQSKKNIQLYCTGGEWQVHLVLRGPPPNLKII